MSRRALFTLLALTAIPRSALAQNSQTILLKPDRVFDGLSEKAHDGWAVLVRGEKIEAAGAVSELKAADARIMELPGTTLLPGLIEAHSHLLLHPYNETLWD